MKGQAAISLIVFVVIVAAALGVFLILNYNGLVTAEKSVEEAQAQIAVVCQRRLDLLPNLIETVKAYAKHEKELLTAVTSARAQAQKALKTAVQGKAGAGMAAVAGTQAGVTTAVRGLFAVVENYPNLRSASNFLALQDQLEGAENRISVARQRYNAVTKKYNTKIETFPGVFLAPIFGFTGKEFFEARDEKAYEPIKAQF